MGSCLLSSKTLVHAGSRVSSGEAQKALDAMMKETEPDTSLTDITNADRAAKPKQVQKKSGIDKQVSDVQKSIKPVQEEARNQSKKRPLNKDSIQSSQPEKKKKQDQSKSCRRKLLPQVKGQQQLTNFFRS